MQAQMTTPSTPTVAELLKTHAATVALLQQETKEFQGKDIGVPFDELFVLRFALSNKDVKVALKKLRETLQWRITNLEKLNNAATGEIPNMHTLMKHMFLGTCGWLNGIDQVQIVRAGLSDSVALMNELSLEEIAETLLMANEHSFRVVDAKTREMGVLCKMMSIIDLHGLSMSRFNRKFSNALNANSHASNVYFPQLLRCSVVMNLPWAFRVMFAALSKLAPKEALEKQRMCPGKPHSGQSAGDCPYLTSRLGSREAAVAFVPPFLGGTAAPEETLKHPSD